MELQETCNYIIGAAQAVILLFILILEGSTYYHQFCLSEKHEFLITGLVPHVPRLIYRLLAEIEDWLQIAFLVMLLPTLLL